MFSIVESPFKPCVNKLGEAKGNVTSKYESELSTPLKLQLSKDMPPKAIADDGNNKFNMSPKVSSTKVVPNVQVLKFMLLKELKTTVLFIILLLP